MPSVQINNANINTFCFTATFDLLAKKIVLNASCSSYAGSSGNGIFSVSGISFLIQDEEGVTLSEINFTDPTKYIVPSVTQEFEVDLSALNYAFFFQTFKIVGAIKDNVSTYYTTPVYAKVCEPLNFTESGWVPGTFVVTANCPDNVLTVKDITVFTYNNTTPDSKTTSGTLYYPTGTISSIAFTGTPFSNNVIYTGEYRVNNDTTATYTITDGVFVEVTYRTQNQFDITCANKIGDLMCCIVDLQNSATKNCNNAIGKAASQKMYEIMPVFLVGLAKEINGQDASAQATFIRKALSCNCGVGSLGQNQMTPINPAVTNIVLNGVGGTSIAAPTTVGSTKTFNIQSNVYQVVKGNTGDLAFTITTDTSTANTVKYKITFNYAVQAGYILTAIGNNPSLITQLNSLINFTNFNIDLDSLNGSCVINLSSLNYFLSAKVVGAGDGFKNITINGTTYTPSVPIAVNSVGAIETYLNGLGLGTFEVSYSNGTTGAYFNILTTGNANTVTGATIIIGGSDTAVPFQKTNKSLIAVLQAIIDYLCGLTALQMALGNALSLCTIDYNGNVVTTNYSESTTQSQYNSGLSTAICNLANRIATLTGVTCDTLNDIFEDNVSAAFNGGIARAYGKDQNGNCVSYTVEQLALGVMQAANAYSTVKAAFGAIECGTPGTCPDVSGVALGIISGNIGFYSLTWSTTPLAVQTVTLQYKLSSSSVWITASNSIQVFPNGSINGTTPVQILGLTPGQTYNVKVLNNCGGAGFVQTITVPTSSIFSDSYLLDNSLYLICGNSPVTLYSGSSFGTGTIMYTDAGLTIPLTGYTYITLASGGDIYQVNTSTGLVGTNTGSQCSSGTAAEYALGNNSGTICASPTQTLYTNGAFAIGLVIYYDSALTTPVTGFDYLVNVTTLAIYNLNNASGVIGTATGSSCTSVSTSLKLSNSYDNICAQSNTTVYTNGVFGVSKTLYSDSGLTTPITGYIYVSDGGAIYNLNTVTGVVGSALAQACGQVGIYNGSAGATVTAITGITGYALTGTITPGLSQQGTHVAFSASIQMTLSGAASGTAILRKNGSVIDTQPTFVGTITFAFNSFVVGDVILIQFT